MSDMMDEWRKKTVEDHKRDIMAAAKANHGYWWPGEVIGPTKFDEAFRQLVSEKRLVPGRRERDFTIWLPHE